MIEYLYVIPAALIAIVLHELGHGLVSYIDDRIFGDQRLFEKKYEVAQNYRDLKECLKPVLYRTLRKDVKYLKFTSAGLPKFNPTTSLTVEGNSID